MQVLRGHRSVLLAAQLFTLITQVSKGSESRAIALAAELDLTLSQLRALVALWQAHEPLSVGALADAVGLSDAAAVRMVDGLLLNGLAARREDEHDRRIKRISLSAAGREAVTTLVAAKRESLEALTSTLLDEEVDLLSAALGAILTRLELPLDLPASR
ncbi:MAG TPA: MarR family transcriptional regulator [Solirubrobacteraceae bacterium]|nr:MarR family transcriptional regulator [Solirubrobacteraceae bacterium]